MRLPPKRRSILRLSVALAVLAVAFIFGACGDDGSASDATAAPTTIVAVSSDSTAQPSPSSSADTSASTGASTSLATATTSSPATTMTETTMTTGPTVTTAKPTTTTIKVTTTTAAPTTTTAKPTTTTVKAATALTISGPDGTKDLSMADLRALSATSGYGGWKNQLGNITAPAFWKGVSLRSLMELVGGGGSVTVVASDGYSQTLSTGQAGGSVNTYDPATGEAVSGISVKAIVAYAKGGGGLGSGEGPLRIAFVSSEKDQVTDSDMWVKHVVELRVN